MAGWLPQPLYFMKIVINKKIALIVISYLFVNFIFVQLSHSCFSEQDIKGLNSNKVLRILSHLEKSTKEGRYKYFGNCEIGIYDFAESILKSDYLSDVQKLDYYLRIQPLYPNNAELGSVLNYDRIKIFMKYKKRPLKDIVDSVEDPALKKRIKGALLDADMLIEQ